MTYENKYPFYQNMEPKERAMLEELPRETLIELLLEMVNGLGSVAFGTITQVEAMCESCIFDPAIRQCVRTQVRNCESKTCSLHPVRDIRAQLKEAIR